MLPREIHRKIASYFYFYFYYENKIIDVCLKDHFIKNYYLYLKDYLHYGLVNKKVYSLISPIISFHREFGAKIINDNFNRHKQIRRVTSYQFFVKNKKSSTITLKDLAIAWKNLTNDQRVQFNNKATEYNIKRYEGVYRDLFSQLFITEENL